ncbi:glycosyltransferase family 2 protein [Marinobacter salinisoli]|uniref:Glycosyltransferase family 2 protein n=1 Tax=Marinobacter salinisoli TaxID=2769486 RepID=A0ABX7MPA5_9GAMM|nr:glycosyltransferase family 2 protein [Marinobacter salinisoli]QSP93979.1 glycosyltransferase family 2 protein [Marinobacter salinisoli]
MPKVSVIMPVYNVADFVGQAITSVLEQTFTDFELIIVDDCSPDHSIEICRSFSDPRINIIQHTVNRGLAGARNSGIREAQGDYLAFLDSDDFWRADKLELHVRHLENQPRVGVSFSRSAFVSADGQPTSFFQMPKLKDITASHLFCRNPVGNGSAPVIRREVFEQIGYEAAFQGSPEVRYFNSDLRQSEDIECWLRIVLTTDWQMEGIPEPLTFYRLNAGGLSANLHKQLASWEQLAVETANYAPDFVTEHYPRAKSYQLRYLARQAIRLGDGKAATGFVNKSFGSSLRPLREEAMRTITTFAAAYLLWSVPWLYQRTEKTASEFIGKLQQRRIQKDVAGS